MNVSRVNPPCRVEEILTQLAFVGAIVGTGTSNPDTTTAAILLKDLLCECENCQPTDALDAEEPAVSKPWDLNSLLDCVRDDLHPDQIRSLLREAYDAGRRWAVEALRAEAA